MRIFHHGDGARLRPLSCPAHRLRGSPGLAFLPGRDARYQLDRPHAALMGPRHRRAYRRAPGHVQPVVAVAASTDAGSSSPTPVRAARCYCGTPARDIAASSSPGPGLRSGASPSRPTAAGCSAAAADGAVCAVWDTDTARRWQHPCPPQSTEAGRRARAVHQMRRLPRAHHQRRQPGPAQALQGVLGRRAGSVPGYPYSRALRQSGIVWTPRRPWPGCSSWGRTRF